MQGCTAPFLIRGAELGKTNRTNFLDILMQSMKKNSFSCCSKQKTDLIGRCKKIISVILLRKSMDVDILTTS